jgi:HK97 family phage major capsid protein
MPAFLSAAAFGPRPVLDRPDDGSGADVVLAEFKALNADVREALKSAGMKGTEIEQRVGELDMRVLGISQRLAARGEGGVAMSTKTIGERFVEHDGLKAFAAETNRPGRFRLDIEQKAITSASSYGGPVAPAGRDVVNMMPRRVLRVRDLIPEISVTTGAVEWPRQTTRTNNAAVAGEGTLKGESTYAWELITTPIRTVAHWTLIARQLLDDAPALAGAVNEELTFGLDSAVDAEILLGDGTGVHLLGLIPQAEAYSAPFVVSDATMLDKVALALLQCSLNDYVPDGIVMHPSDFLRIRLLKDSEGRYIFGSPGAEEPAPRLFGIPVATTTSISIDKLLVGSFKSAATIFARMGNRLEVSTEDSDNFRKNLATLLMECRLGLATKRADALVYADFGNVS